MNRKIDTSKKIAAISTMISVAAGFIIGLCVLIEELFKGHAIGMLPLYMIFLACFVLVIAAPLAVVMWIIYGLKCLGKVKKGPSAYLVVGSLAALGAILSAVYGIYDMATDTGMFAGLAGALTMMFIVPFFVIVFIIDIVVWLIFKKKGSVESLGRPNQPIYEDLRKCFQDTMHQIENNSELRKYTLNAIEKTRVYEEKFCSKSDEDEETAEVILEENTTFAAAKKYKLCLTEAGKLIKQKVAVLNFANPHTPGGGVVNGAMAQEECLCRSSDLYATLVTQKVTDRYYKYHKEETNYLFSDRIIYSPNITVFKTDDDVPQMMEKEEWFQVDVITCAAPYLSEMTYVNPEELLKLFENRIQNIFEVALENKVEVLILGAFGCGAFGNPPEIVAQAFHHVIESREGRYKKRFKKIIFAIKSSVAKDFSLKGLEVKCPNIAAFENEFSTRVQ